MNAHTTSLLPPGITPLCRELAAKLHKANMDMQPATLSWEEVHLVRTLLTESYQDLGTSRHTIAKLFR